MARKYLALEGDSELVEQKESNFLPQRYNPLKAYLSELRKYPVLSSEDEHEVALKVYEKKDLSSVDRLTVSNLGLVVKIAMSYYNTYVNILDLIQEGNVGLLHGSAIILAKGTTNSQHTHVLDSILHSSIYNELLEPR